MNSILNEIFQEENEMAGITQEVQELMSGLSRQEEYEFGQALKKLAGIATKVVGSQAPVNVAMHAGHTSVYRDDAPPSSGNKLPEPKKSILQRLTDTYRAWKIAGAIDKGADSQPDRPLKDRGKQSSNQRENENEWTIPSDYSYDAADNYEFEEGEEPVPPTLRSPGTPPPPTRRDGRGQLPVPPINDNEPPTVRLPLPRKVQRFRPSTNAPLQKNGPRPSIKREFEVPLMEEIFMEAEEAGDKEYSFEDDDTMEYMVDKRKDKSKSRAKGKNINIDDDGPLSDEPIVTPAHKTAGTNPVNAPDLQRVFMQEITSVMKDIGMTRLPRNSRDLSKEYSNHVIATRPAHLHMMTRAEIKESMKDFLLGEKSLKKRK